MLPINIFKRLGGSPAKGDSTIYNDAVTGVKYAQWTIGSDGWTYKRNTSGASFRGQAWLSPQIGMSNYEVRATVASGDIPPGIIGAWLDLGASQTWGWVNQTTAESCELTIEIRRKSDLAIIKTASVSIVIMGIE